MSALTDLRDHRRSRLAATALAVVLGLALALFHWVGLVLAGALVALPQRSLRRGVAAGAGVGVLVVAGFLTSFALAGTLGPALAMGQPTALALGIGLVLPLLGSLARGVV